MVAPANRSDAPPRAVVDRIDWPCEVVRNFSENNLGCRQRVASGLDWAFSLVDEMIILEDDILPHPDFFPFVAQMLEHYRDDQRVMMVTGFNPVGRWKSDQQDYHFSYCGSIWGWGSWRRAWKHYDVDMKLWGDPQVRDHVRNLFVEPELYQGRMQAYDKVYRGEVDTWDFQWSVARLAKSAVSVVPAVNLVRNVGFRPDATHTRKPRPTLEAVDLHPLHTPVRLHNHIAADREYDLAFTRALK